MFLERRQVSRKTPDDGKLEITRVAAAPLRALPPEFTLEVNGARGRGRIGEMECMCRGEAERHVHYFLGLELLKSLPAGGHVTLDMRDDDGERGRHGSAVVAVASV